MDDLTHIWSLVSGDLHQVWLGLLSLARQVAETDWPAETWRFARDLRAEQGLVLIGLAGLLVLMRLSGRLRPLARIEQHAARLDRCAERLSAEMAELHALLLDYQARVRGNAPAEAIPMPAAEGEAAPPEPEPAPEPEPEPEPRSKPRPEAEPEVLADRPAEPLAPPPTDAGGPVIPMPPPPPPPAADKPAG